MFKTAPFQTALPSIAPRPRTTASNSPARLRRIFQLDSLDTPLSRLNVRKYTRTSKNDPATQASTATAQSANSHHANARAWIKHQPSTATADVLASPIKKRRSVRNSFTHSIAGEYSTQKLITLH